MLLLLVKWTALHSQLRNGHADVAKVLIQNGADVNAVINTKGRHFMSQQRKDNDIAKVLIQNGVDVNAVDEDESTALHTAAEPGHVDVVKVLIRERCRRECC